jgi:ketosteroid isomerase-like protein
VTGGSDTSRASSDEALIREVNDAVAAGDLQRTIAWLHPEVVWEHNLGGGTPEEGVYRGRDEVASLLERIVEPWEYLRVVAQDVRPLGGGAYHITGELHAKHSTSRQEIVSPYEQLLEIRDGLAVKSRMVNGPRATGTALVPPRSNAAGTQSRAADVG